MLYSWSIILRPWLLFSWITTSGIASCYSHIQWNTSTVPVRTSFGLHWCSGKMYNMYQCKVDVDMLNVLECVGWHFEHWPFVRAESLCSDKGLFNTWNVSQHTLRRSAYPHQPYIDTSYIIISHIVHWILTFFLVILVLLSHIKKTFQFLFIFVFFQVCVLIVLICSGSVVWYRQRKLEEMVYEKLKKQVESDTVWFIRNKEVQMYSCSLDQAEPMKGNCSLSKDALLLHQRLLPRLFSNGD